jgi:hypothetical protein
MVGLAAAAVLAGGTCALVCAPRWYRPPVLPADQRQQVRNNLVAAEQAFTESLRGGFGPFIYHIYQDDLNRWITMRKEIYPLLDQLAPPGLADPFVVFRRGTITVAGRCTLWRLGLVLSVDIVPRLEADALVLQAQTVRIGSIPVSASFAGGLGLSQQVDKQPDKTWPGSPRICGSLAAGLRIDSTASWANGGVLYRVTDVTVEPGQLKIMVEPLGHQPPKDRKHHWPSSSSDAARSSTPFKR